MRKLITTAVDPLILSSSEDVKRRLQNEIFINKLQEKVKLLEAFAFKKVDEDHQGTILDDFEARMLKCEVKVTQDKEMLHSFINQKMQGMDNQIFDMAARVAECQVVKT